MPRTNERLSITIAPDVKAWLEKRTEDGPDKIFASKSFAIEFALRHLMEERKYA